MPATEAEVIIEEVTVTLTDIVGQYHLTCDVEGHIDDVPIRSFRFPSNWELSASRSANVVRKMTELGRYQKKVLELLVLRTCVPKLSPETP